MRPADHDSQIRASGQVTRYCPRASPIHPKGAFIGYFNPAEAPFRFISTHIFQTLHIMPESVLKLSLGAVLAMASLPGSATSPDASRWEGLSGRDLFLAVAADSRPTSPLGVSQTGGEGAYGRFWKRAKPLTVRSATVSPPNGSPYQTKRIMSRHQPPCLP